jgi:DNA transposition AAA+ family ATPase
MTGLTDTPDFVDTTHQRRTLGRITGAAGLVTIVVVLGSSIANDY